jgi:hypothetical protein
MTSVASTPVEVNLNVEINANGNLAILSEGLRYPNNVIVARETLLASALYAETAGVPSSGLIEFWEDAEIDGIKAQIANDGGAGSPFANFYKASAKALAQGLQKVLCGEMSVRPSEELAEKFTDTSKDASPFNAAKYDDNNHVMEHFGRVALGCYAHYIFGHAQATAAITNDKEFIQKMLSLSSTDHVGSASTSTQRYDNWSKKTEVAAEEAPLAWKDIAVPAAAAEADLARRLVGKILANNHDGTNFIVSAETEAAASAKVIDIVKQVIGRDASRATDVDNNKYDVEKHGMLRFYAGDVLYVNIHLVKPTVTVGSGQRIASTYADLLTTATPDEEESYSIRITLA